MRVCVSWKRGKVFMRLNDSRTSFQVYDKLPLTVVAQTWGGEVYFNVAVYSTLEPDACQIVEPGTVCFWVEGNSVAIPFGPTPASQEQECRLVTLVNVIGKVESNVSSLKSIRAGDEVTLTKA